jgi:predicted nucleotidyltransferase
MVRKSDIQAWCDEVGREFDPERIILFGSRAADSAHRDSDVDLLIVMRLRKGERGARKAATIRNQVQARFPMDLIVRSPEEIERRVAQGDQFLKQILSDGRVLYEAKHA